MKFSELIENAMTCVKTFNPVIMSLDSHADEFIKNVSIAQQILFSYTHTKNWSLFIQFKDPYEKVFVKQVFYGCIRY